jgi:glucosyl-3-phosphoglycerate synthase
VIRGWHHAEFPPERLRDARLGTISVCVPAREVADTIAGVVEPLVELREAGAIDEVAVVDAASRDGTADIAREAGAVVHQEAELLPEFGPVLGKGDAMWRSLSVLEGEVLCFLDGDTTAFGAHFACGLAGAVACEEGVRFVKAAYRRPFRVGDVQTEEGGGRVNELTARPLLRRFYPELADIRQPLAGEVAGRRELLERLPFATGYAVEIAMLLDAWRAAGVEGIGQVDLDERLNAHQPLSALGGMADAVLGVVAERLAREGRLTDTGADEAGAGAIVERPPFTTLPD